MVPIVDTLYYTTTDGQITSPNPSTSTVSNWFEPAQLVSNTYGSSVGMMGFDRSLTAIVDGNDDSGRVGAFLSNTTITMVSNSNITHIGSYAFRNNPIQSVSFPACTTIGDYAFRETSLQTAYFPNVTTIGENAFTKCSSLQSVSFPACTTIGGSAFMQCTSLQNVNIPKVSKIEAATFTACDALQSITLPNCTHMCDMAFNECPVLQVVSLPKCILLGNGSAGYGGGVFHNCSNLTSIYLGASTVCVLAEYALFGLPSNCSIYVPASLVSAYQAASGWSYYSSRIFAIPE